MNNFSVEILLFIPNSRWDNKRQWMQQSKNLINIETRLY